ncbi:similar to Saccharomyces cerevisiae YLR292C SEC72 Non-essential subunit of Sec63 complex (Sec63p, Sec62p, Sec66p and Sec72p) [Maudiozyma barnettii]|uniref:Similar to Saccharomyces cerevisiae YLR292C SEC72 Non-essential subunit of Sec63 complex (Sec63p, Sec62p, Sec66p and Sec72p) n=1 Tax=Maudiozyma barnettii TaxID=61262 RepID=A0A8H2VI67_9SACH|nr:Sec63 complex subunit SEC72 [Kazachstania barnettii]CAB4255850.1 similar to Saccharomyces cerevisiae YLR292C SEC72 Non-essential subunit of Sec63 complex (Sec63p, Sec62p, Sec66p and Sec72p) [Kazachstania barnettii]CAD1784410.1 similar to Saccharomyces cerevisiae YLR292C SEC72 Non-essential subunit of Sec63 complex (Sec63p, Sec62p, Sec66p and Sec72p) [Kazachstania barnettii]
MATILYNQNSKVIKCEDSDLTETREISINQINKLSAAIIAESNPNFTPQPNDEHSKMIKSLFESGLAMLKQKKMQDALKNIALAVDMAQRSRAPYEAFGIQLQEIQFMLRHKIDLSLITGRYLDALQDIEFLMNTGMAQADVYIRKSDALLKLSQFDDARICCERGLSLHPNETKLKALMLEINRRLAEYNGDN